MSFGQITIADNTDSIILNCTDKNSTFGFQPQTIYSSIQLERSAYGTAQLFAPPSTVSAKRVWTFSGVFLPASDVNVLRGFLNGAAQTFTLSDECWEKLITGTAATGVSVRLFSNGNWLGKAYADLANNTTQFEVTFAAWEI